MNVFVIPSWYPSSDYPTCGQFSLDQVEGLGKMNPSFNFGISLWGQQEEANLLWVKQPFKSIKKLLKFRQRESFKRKISRNITEIYTPALTWTRTIWSGNIRNIIKVNFNNLKLFQEENGKVDIIHAHVSFPAGYIAMHLSKKLNVPFIITEHLDPFPTKFFQNRNGGLSHFIDKPLKKASMVIVENDKLLANIKKFGIERLTCIPNMVNERLFIPSIKTNADNKLTFLYIGDMIDRKGINYLLEAIVHLKKLPVHFIFCGTGEKLKEYKLQAKRLQISEYISWVGYLSRSEIVSKFQLCDAFVLPSISENLGMVLLEAIACGKPVIATKCGGPEAIINEKNGLLASVGDSRDLAEKIKWMVKNHHTFDPKIIREDFLNRFSRPVVSSQIIQLYNKILDKAEPTDENSALK